MTMTIAQIFPLCVAPGATQRAAGGSRLAGPGELPGESATPARSARGSDEAVRPSPPDGHAGDPGRPALIQNTSL